MPDILFTEVQNGKFNYGRRCWLLYEMIGILLIKILEYCLETLKFEVIDAINELEHF